MPKLSANMEHYDLNSMAGKNTEKKLVSSKKSQKRDGENMSNFQKIDLLLKKETSDPINSRQGNLQADISKPVGIKNSSKLQKDDENSKNVFQIMNQIVAPYDFKKANNPEQYNENLTKLLCHCVFSKLGINYINKTFKMCSFKLIKNNYIKNLKSLVSNAHTLNAVQFHDDL